MPADLWQRLQEFEFDKPGVSLTFAARLAEENGWTRHYAGRIVEEYRRFLFLCIAAGHPVTPSDQVDQAWHLHLAYTRSYWDDLCGGVLGRPLHHGPTEGGAEESAKFHDWYARTLASYERLFGASPPADIWPAPADRFAARFVRVDRARYLLLARARVAAAAGLGAAVSACAILAGCTRVLSPREWGIAVGIFLVIFFLCVLVRKVARGGGSGDGCGGGWWGGGCGGDSGGDSGCGGGGCGGGGCGGGD